jgi:hypothetical protein
MSLLQLLSAVVIRYSQIRNKPILNAFKNNFVRFLVFFACFENIMQHKKYTELGKKIDDVYDLKIFMIINTHKKHPLYYYFYP